MTATDITQIPMSSDLGATLARGADFAGSSGAAEVSLEHLLAALCDDPDAGAVLDASQINAERLKADVVARVLQGTEPSPERHDSLGVSKDVRRILEAAAAAARGSRRRDINGAIVLAAIVGDARSMAAQILEAHGLTFDNAIRALQAALAPPREAPAAPPPPVADDVLARARERVQSRATPSLREIMKDMPRPAPPAPPPPSPYPAAAVPSAPAPAPSPEELSVPLPEVVSAPEPQREQTQHTQEPARQEPTFSSTSAATGSQPQTEAAPSPALDAPAPAPSFPGPLDPQLPTGGEREAPGAHQHRHEPSFGGGAPAAQPERPQPGRAQPEPSWSHPAWQGQQAPAAPARPNDQSFQQPYQPGPASPQASPAPPPDIFADLPPRPQPSRIQPPPIPPGAPIHGGPVNPRMRGPMPSGPVPSAPMPSAPMGPAQGAPMAPGSAPPGSRSALGHDPAFRADSPMGPPVSQRPAPDGKVRRKEKRAKGQNVDTGQLAENIPRSMRVGKTSRAEIRIAKSSVKALTEGLEGGGQVWQHAVAVTKAMSVRVRAPEGGFFIESASPETQWIESNLGYASDDFASWRFLITPQSRGWSSLQIIVSARTIGADGVAAETALPDQTIEVKVRANIARTLTRFLGWTVAAVLGGALATFGESGMALMQKVLH